MCPWCAAARRRADGMVWIGMIADRDRKISTLEREIHKINQAAGQDNCTNMFLREWKVVQVQSESRVLVEN